MNQKKTNSKKLALVSIKHMVDKSDYHKAEYYKIYEHLIPPFSKLPRIKSITVSYHYLQNF